MILSQSVARQSLNWNIARGTTDPGYWVYNLNHFFDWNKFAIILTEKDHLSEDSQSVSRQTES